MELSESIEPLAKMEMTPPLSFLRPPTTPFILEVPKSITAINPDCVIFSIDNPYGYIIV